MLYKTARTLNPCISTIAIDLEYTGVRLEYIYIPITDIDPIGVVIEAFLLR